jgi:glycerophosphoryl diester phosphodiesterase
MIVKVAAFIAIVFTISSCRKDSVNIRNLEGNRIICLGHGGMGNGAVYPMNTFESIQKCLSLGMDGSELDVQLTKDNVPVAYHDADLSSSTTGQGMINDHTWNEIKQEKYDETLYLHYSILALDDLFQHLKAMRNSKYTFDCKLYTSAEKESFYDAYIAALVHIIQKYRIEDNIYIESQDIVFLNKIQVLLPDAKLFIYPSTFEEGLAIALEYNLYGITISTNNVTESQIAEAHINNIRVAIWDIQSMGDIEDGVAKNPDMIQTDNVQALLSLLK